MISEVGRCVLDTNTLVSAFLFPNSNPGIVLTTVLERGTLLMSLETAEELASVLRREKFDRYLTRKGREELLAAAICESELVEVHSIIEECRDSSDNKILATAVDGNATTIISGDADLLVLNPYRDIQIGAPGEFLKQLRIG